MTPPATAPPLLRKTQQKTGMNAGAQQMSEAGSVKGEKRQCEPAAAAAAAGAIVTVAVEGVCAEPGKSGAERESENPRSDGLV